MSTCEGARRNWRAQGAANFRHPGATDTSDGRGSGTKAWPPTWLSLGARMGSESCPSTACAAVAGARYSRQMWRTREGGESEGRRAARTRPRSPAADAGHAGEQRILALQRLAGNRAVNRILASRGQQGTPEGLIQRVLEEFPGVGTDGQSTVLEAGQKNLFRETDDGKLYFKSARSTETDWVLIEVVAAEGGKYRKTGAERRHTVEKKAPETVQDWSRYAHISGANMLYPSQKYPHVTIDLSTPGREPKDRIVFETMHYSRSADDPFRSGYRRTSGGWQPVAPNTKKDKQQECDDAIDHFLATVGLTTRVIRAN
jgi:hypothetical protein